jgi:hypothetical protein
MFADALHVWFPVGHSRHAFVKPAPPTLIWGKRWIDTRYRASLYHQRARI